MKTITMPVFDRPEYLSRTLETLSKNDLSDYTLFINVEPCSKEIRDIVESIDFMPTDIKFNTTRLRERLNPFTVIKRAFDSGSEFSCHFDSDLVISPDATLLLNWYFNTFKDSPLSFTSYCLFNYNSDPNRPTELTVLPKAFQGLGFGWFPDNWNIIKEFWFDDTLCRKLFGSSGWDWRIAAYAVENNMHSIIPNFSRTNHIGRVGTCCTEAWQIKSFDRLVWNQELLIKDYHIV